MQRLETAKPSGVLFYNFKQKLYTTFLPYYICSLPGVPPVPRASFRGEATNRISAPRGLEILTINREI